MENTYYVAKDGSDSNSGTQDEPWETLNRASYVDEHSRVVVGPGIYHEQLDIRNSNVEFIGQGAIIDGSFTQLNWNGLVRISNLENVVVRGFTIQNSSYFGIYIKDNCRNIQITDNEIYECQSSGIIVFHGDGHSEHISITDNIVDTTCMNMNQEGISLSNVKGFSICENKVINCHKEGIDVKYGCQNGHIYNNFVANCADVRPCIYVDAFSKVNKDIEVNSNVCYGNGQGISLATEEGGELYRITVTDNTCTVDSNAFSIHGYNTEGSHLKKDIYVSLNVFWSENGKAIQITDDESNFDNLVMMNNYLEE